MSTRLAMGSTRRSDQVSGRRSLDLNFTTCNFDRKSLKNYVSHHVSRFYCSFKVNAMLQGSGDQMIV